jgi:hypothetical protein
MDLRALKDISLAGTDGRTHRIGDLFADRPVVLVFARHFG